MIEELKELIKSDEFKTWLSNPELWDSLDVDYHPPRVERVWMPFNDKRVSLHVIHPCDRKEVLLHGHIWESAMYVLPIGGKYEHGVGYKNKFPYNSMEIVCTQEFTGDVYYEMLNKWGAHYVRPIGQPVFTIMISGPVKWEENKTKVDKKLEPLSKERKIEILETFKNYFE
jgi:hypothetical protein